MRIYDAIGLVIISAMVLSGCAETRRLVATVPGTQPISQTDPVSVTRDGVTYWAADPTRVDSNTVVSTVHEQTPATQICKLYTMALRDSTGSVRGVDVRLRTLSGSLLWKTSVWLTPDDSSATYVEQTPSDSLTIVRVVAQGRITESYTFDGQQPHDFSWPIDTTPSDSLQSLFAATYTTMGSLSPDANGTMALTIASSTEYSNWLHDAFSVDKTLTSTQVTDIDRWCTMVDGICMAKCALFPGNPACPFCGGYALLCFLVQLYEQWQGN